MTDNPRVCAICASYNRPHLLGQAIAMFEAQDYPNKEMIVLEDSGVFGKQVIEGNNWRIVSFDDEHWEVARKRNWLIADTDADIICLLDDDDWYFPWHISAAVNALRRSQWAQPRQALEWTNGGDLVRHHVFGEPVRQRLHDGNPLNKRDALDCCYGGQWSYRRELIDKVGGYPEGVGNGEDTRWNVMVWNRIGSSADTITDEYPASYVYSRDMSGEIHGSECGVGLVYMTRFASQPKQSSDDFVIQLPEGYDKWTKERIAALPLLPRKW